MKPLKCAVIGCGYLGKFHAQKYSLLENCELIAVVDTNLSQAQSLAEQYQTQAFTDYRLLFGQVDAVSVVVPTTLHHQITKECLQNGIHVLVEKPMTVTIAEADDLIALANELNLILQVGHLERFNPAIMGLTQIEGQPLFIESHRLSPFNPRAKDVSVVLDLMIHDIDIILTLVGANIERIEASGAAVLTSGIDIANARLTFGNGCVANVTASRISLKSERKMRIFKSNAYVIVDFQRRSLNHYHTGDGEMFPGIPNIVSNELIFENGDALYEEIKHFMDCIYHQQTPLVSGMVGRRALETALKITELLA